MRVWMFLLFVSSLTLTACGSRCPSGTVDNGTTCVYQNSAYPYGTSTYNNGYSTYPQQQYYPQQTYGGSGYYYGQ